MPVYQTAQNSRVQITIQIVRNQYDGIRLVVDHPLVTAEHGTITHFFHIQMQLESCAERSRRYLSIEVEESLGIKHLKKIVLQTNTARELLQQLHTPFPFMTKNVLLQRKHFIVCDSNSSTPKFLLQNMEPHQRIGICNNIPETMFEFL